jgi:hypothetical protein
MIKYYIYRKKDGRVGMRAHDNIGFEPTVLGDAVLDLPPDKEKEFEEAEATYFKDGVLTSVSKLTAREQEIQKLKDDVSILMTDKKNVSKDQMMDLISRIVNLIE